MANRSDTGIGLDTKSWITLFEANANHQLSSGSSGFARDLIKAVRRGDLQVQVYNPASGDQWIISASQVANCAPELLTASTIEDAPYGPLVDFSGWIAVLDRLQFEKWSEEHLGSRRSVRGKQAATLKILNDLHPQGVPKALSDKELTRQVSREYEKQKIGLPPSQETVRRAAGRRKSE